MKRAARECMQNREAPMRHREVDNNPAKSSPLCPRPHVGNAEEALPERGSVRIEADKSLKILNDSSMSSAARNSGGASEMKLRDMKLASPSKYQSKAAISWRNVR